MPRCVQSRQSRRSWDGIHQRFHNEQSASGDSQGPTHILGVALVVTTRSCFLPSSRRFCLSTTVVRHIFGVHSEGDHFLDLYSPHCTPACYNVGSLCQSCRSCAYPINSAVPASAACEGFLSLSRLELDDIEVWIIDSVNKVVVRSRDKCVDYQRPGYQCVQERETWKGLQEHGQTYTTNINGLPRLIMGVSYKPR